MGLLKKNIDYCGKDVNIILREAFAETLFHKRFGARVVSGVKSRAIYWNVESKVELQAYHNCPGDSAFDDVELRQNGMELCEYMALARFTHNDLIQTARELNYKKGFLAEKFPDDKDLFYAILDAVSKSIAQQWDDVIINGEVGAPGYLGLCDGFKKMWQNDASVLSVPSVPANLTPTAVIDELNKLWNAIPKELQYNPRYQVKFGVSVKIARVYQQYLSQHGFAQWSADANTPLLFAGSYPLIPLNQLKDDEMFATYPENLMLVYDDAEDFAKFRTWDEAETSACDRIGMKLMARGGVHYGYGKYIVWYH